MYCFIEPTEIISSFYIVVFKPCQSPSLAVLSHLYQYIDVVAGECLSSWL